MAPRLTPDPAGLRLLDCQGGPFDTSAFRRALASTTPWRDVSFAAQLADGTECAVALFARLGVAVSVPMGYGGLVSTRPLSPEEVSCFLTAARAAAGARRLILRYLDSASAPARTLVVVLDRDSDLEARFHKAARYALRRGEREGLTTRATSDPEPFLSLYQSSATVWATRYPATLIAELAKSKAALFYEVRAGGTVIGASMALVAPVHWMYWLASQSEEGRRRNSGYLALATLLRDAQVAGATMVNLGASQAGEVDLTGVAYFKKRMGGEPRSMVERVEASSFGRLEHRLEGVLRPWLWRARRRLAR